MEAKRLMSGQMTDFNGNLKLLQFPEGRNQVLLQLENLADLFDGPAPTEPYPFFDLYQYALQLFIHNNDGSYPDTVTIVERNLSNNQDLATMQKNKFKWLSADSANERLAQEVPEVANDTVIPIMPQHIRLFRITYTVAEQTAFLE